MISVIYALFLASSQYINSTFKQAEKNSLLGVVFIWG